MQGKDPFLALLGLFILSTTFFFCGERSVSSPPPVALENLTESPAPAQKVIEPPVSASGRAVTMSGSGACWFWAVVGAGLLGWGIKGVVLGPMMDEKRREVERLTSKVSMLANQPPEVRTVEKRVEVPVERVVVKRIEVPVEKVVDRPVDNPEHLSRIKALESEVAVIAGLLAKIAQLQTVSSQVGERSFEGRVVVPVDNPEQLARIKALEDEVAVIAELRVQMAALRSASLQAGKKVVEQRIEIPTEQQGETPIDKASEPATNHTPAGVVQQSNEEEADKESPDDLKQIRGVGPALERFLHKRGVFWFRQVATWSQADIDRFEFLLPNFSGRIQRENWVRSAQVEHYKKYKHWLGEGELPTESSDLRAQITQLQAVSPQVGEKSVEKWIETPAEQIVVKHGDVPVEVIGTDTRDLDEASAVEQSSKGEMGKESPDDLKQIRGVGPALERFLHKRGVFWFHQVATWSQADIDKFEFLLPNFSGRIQRENWVRSAQVEYYKKYKQWLGEGEPPSESFDLREQRDQLQAASSEVSEEVIEKPIESLAETQLVKNGTVPVETISAETADLDQASAGDQSGEGQAGRELLDDLKQIRGVGPALERFLHKRGVFWFHQVANWSQADIDKFEFLLPNFSGRIQRENWVRSAQLEYYKKYKKSLGGDAPPSTPPETPSV